MVDTTEPADVHAGEDESKPDLLSLAGLASLAAGAIHATAAGAHSENKEAVWAFVGVALFQLAWGALALLRSGRLLALVGLAGNAAALGGWVLAKTEGIGFVEGLDEKENVQLADGLAAGLAGAAVLFSLFAVLGIVRLVRQPGVPLAGLASLVVLALAVPGMYKTGSHSHSGGAGHDDMGGHGHDGETAEGDDHSEGEHANTPKPYDPKLPIDLSGMEGVTPEQQAAAENAIAITLARLPQFADPAVAFAAGYRSIGDSLTGHEHFIKWDLINDDKVLDPDYPEALVYAVDNGNPMEPTDKPPPPGTRRLVSAMFMLKQGATLETVPEFGGALTQWHIHDDLCFTEDAPGPEGPQVRGVTEVGGTCEAPLQKFTPVPMIHIWIEPHPCGPFAALEGVGAGQIKEGEERLCDHAHGAT